MECNSVICGLGVIKKITIGTVIFQAGERSNAFFRVESGTVVGTVVDSVPS